jgi:hypothetical protein
VPDASGGLLLNSDNLYTALQTAGKSVTRPTRTEASAFHAILARETVANAYAVPAGVRLEGATNESTISSDHHNWRSEAGRRWRLPTEYYRWKQQYKYLCPYAKGD